MDARRFLDSEDARRFIAGGTAGCMAKTMVAPFERVRIAAQVAVSVEARARSSVNIVREIVRLEGVTGLWRSNGVAVLRTFPAKAVVFGGNDYYTSVFSGVVPRHWIGALAGGLAGLTAVACTYPLDVLRTKLAAQSADGGSRGGVVQTAIHVVRTRGPSGFYTGMAPTLFGGTFYEAARFGVFDVLRRQSVFDDPRWASAESGVPRQRVWWANLACGSLAGVTAGLLLYPNDTIRRQLQMGRNSRYSCAARSLLANGGVARLYAGVVPYLLRAAPGTAVQFAAFAELKRLLDVGSGSSGR